MKIFKSFVAIAAFTAAILPISQPAFAQGEWPIGAGKAGQNWSVARVEEGCYLVPNADPNGTRPKLASSSETRISIDSILFTDPRFAPFSSNDLVTTGVLTLDGQVVTVPGTIIFNFPNPDGPDTPMAVVMFDPSVSATFQGRPVEASFTYKGVTATATIDPSAAELAAWRACTAEMRGRK